MKDIQERIALLEQSNQQQAEEIAALKKQLKAPDKKERWRAEKGGTYYHATSNNDTSYDTDSYTGSDARYYEAFNYFQTKEEAERIARVQLAYRKLDWAIRQFKIHDNGYRFYHNGMELKMDHGAMLYSPLPFLERKEDAEYILSNYQSELLTFLTGGREMKDYLENWLYANTKMNEFEIRIVAHEMNEVAIGFFQAYYHKSNRGQDPKCEYDDVWNDFIADRYKEEK